MGPRLLTVLVERLERAEAGMQTIRGAPDVGVARREARTVLDQLVGPGGRHTSPTAAGPGILPAAQPTLTDPGIVLTIFGNSQDIRVSQAMLRVIGDIERWQQPADRWAQIDAAVAAWTPTNNSIQNLDGRVMRLVAWSLLTQGAQDTSCAHEFGANGLVDALMGLSAAREALVIACRWEEVQCV